MTLPWKRWAIAASGASGVVIAVLLLAWAFKSCQPTPKPKIDPKTQKSIDSLDNTKPAFEHTKDSIITVIIHDTVRSTVVDRAANQSRARAQVAEHRADSLAEVARQHTDSALLWHNAYDARTTEADSLRKAFAQKDSALKSQRAAFTDLSKLYAGDTLRRIAIEHVNDGLKRDIAKLQEPCTVPGTFGRIPCPSRTVTMVLTVVAVKGVEQAVKSLKP